MPNTITAYYEFTAGSTIKSAEHNTNFSNHRGTLIPIEENTAAASNLSHNLGSTDYRWSNLYSDNVFLGQTTSGWSIQDQTTAVGDLEFSADGTVKFGVDTTGAMVVPDLSTTPSANPSAGFEKIYVKNGNVKHLSSGGTESDVASSLLTWSTITANYSVTTSDVSLFVNASTAAFTLTMPEETAASGLVFTIKKEGTDYSAVTINDDAASEITTLNTSGETIKLASDGTNWNILDRYIPKALGSFGLTVSSSNTTLTYYGYRNGKHLECQYKAAFTGTPVGNVNFNLTGSSLAIDTTDFSFAASDVVANVSKLLQSGVDSRHATLRYGSSTQLQAMAIDLDANSTNSYRRLSQTNFSSMTNGSQIEGWFKIPISGWKD